MDERYERRLQMYARRIFKLGTDFPYEGFVQLSIEAHFMRLGFTIDADTHADLICFHPLTGERWLIEAKGATSAIGLDFRTGLGQLVQRMSDTSVKHAIAVPDVDGFLRQCRQVSAWVREKLNLYWLIVGQDGVVRLVSPAEDW
ncbi:MAG: hypothetical protein PHT33_12165 [bacterium]|nr:hypothetical protein [bacterium]